MHVSIFFCRSWSKPTFFCWFLERQIEFARRTWPTFQPRWVSSPKRAAESPFGPVDGPSDVISNMSWEHIETAWVLRYLEMIFHFLGDGWSGNPCLEALRDASNSNSWDPKAQLLYPPASISGNIASPFLPHRHASLTPQAMVGETCSQHCIYVYTNILSIYIYIYII